MRARRLLVEEIHHLEFDAGHRFDVEKIDADDPAPALRRADAAAAACDQPPGAAPRSMIFWPVFSK